MADDALKVPKQAVAVELAFVGQAARRVEVFVAEHQAHAYRRQDVLDLFEHEHPFLPAHDVVDQTWSIFNKDTVVWAGVSLPTARAALDDDETEEELYEQRRLVTVELVGGDKLDGELLYTSPAEHARVADHLNLPGRFFRLWCAERLCLVNKNFVLRVVERGP